MSDDGDRTVTLTVPGRLEALLNEAMRSFDVTHGSMPVREALLVALIERGARSVVKRGSTTDPDQRTVGELTVAELADAIGILDIEKARLAARTVREEKEAAATQMAAIMKDVAGMCAVLTPLRRFETVEEIDAFLEPVRATLRQNGGAVAAMMVVGYVHTGAAGDVRYEPNATGTGETLN